MSSRSPSTTGKREWPGLDDRRQDARERIVAPHADHLRARHHDVAHLQVGHVEHALEHRERIGVDQPALGRLAQQLEQLRAVLQAAGQRARQARRASRRRAALVLALPWSCAQALR